MSVTWAKVVIPDERPMSWNQFYECPHWIVRKDEADRVHQLVKAFIDGNVMMFEDRVDIFMTVYFDKRPHDADNIVAKLYIDGLKGKYLENDGHKHVRSVTTRTEIDRKKPRVEIQIRRAI